MSTDEERLYQIALARVPGVNPRRARLLLEHFGSISAACGSLPVDLKAAERTLRFVQREGIRLLFLTDPGYPQLLRECHDPPILLYYKGSCDLNHPRPLAIVGTRRASPYGLSLVERLVSDLAPYDVQVVSGLALGVDAAAHKTALLVGLQTIGVLGSGHDNIYPPQHRDLASRCGVLSELPEGTRPAPYQFPRRNRIIAGMCPATVVVESAGNGGSMLTAELAFGYHREVFAFPGRADDDMYGGCHALIRRQQAALITCAADLTAQLGWTPVRAGRSPDRTGPDPDAALVLGLLREHEGLHRDELQRMSGLANARLSSILLDLEVNASVAALPGNRFRVIQR